MAPYNIHKPNTSKIKNKQDERLRYNLKEKARTRSINDALKALQQSMPTATPVMKLSRMEILTQATDYIEYLERMLYAKQQLQYDHPFQTEHSTHATNQLTNITQEQGYEIEQPPIFNPSVNTTFHPQAPSLSSSSSTSFYPPHHYYHATFTVPLQEFVNTPQPHNQHNSSQAMQATTYCNLDTTKRFYKNT